MQGREGQRYEIIIDPLDQYVIWDQKTGMPAVIQGHVLYGLPEDEAKGVAAMLNDGRTLGAGFIAALLGEELHEEEQAAPAALAM